MLQELNIETTDCEIFDEDDKEKNHLDYSNDVDFERTLSTYQRRQLTSQSTSNHSGIIKKIIDSPDVSSVLDQTGVSAPKFTMICGAIAGAIGENLEECTLSTSTCYRRRKKHREQVVTTIKDDYISTTKSNLVLHWDGKKLQDATNENLALRKSSDWQLSSVELTVKKLLLWQKRKTELVSSLLTLCMNM